MRALILVVSASKKDVSSTTGMQTTVKTSTLFPMRIKQVVPLRMAEMELAIKEKNFEVFGLVTMRESNRGHQQGSREDRGSIHL
jgi:diphosphomevalonate decarboxylase